MNRLIDNALKNWPHRLTAGVRRVGVSMLFFALIFCFVPDASAEMTAPVVRVDVKSALSHKNERLDVLKARRLSDEGQVSAPLSIYKRVLAKHPKQSWLLVEIGDLLVRHGEFQLALPFLERAIKADPLSTDALLLGAFVRDALGHQQEAIQLYRQALLRAPNDARARFNLGRLLFAVGDLEHAERTYRDLIARHKGHWQAYNNLGIVMLERGQPTAALSPLRRAASLQPKDPGVRYNLGRAYAARREYRAALKAFDHSLELLGEDDLSAGSYHFAKGDVLFAMEKYEAAAKSFRRAIALDPENAAAYLNLGSSLGNAGLYTEAVEALSAAANKEPRPEVYRQIAICYYNAQSMDEALQALDKARVLNPKDPATFVLLADVYQAKGAAKEAKDAARAACKLGLSSACKR